MKNLKDEHSVGPESGTEYHHTKWGTGKHTITINREESKKRSHIIIDDDPRQVQPNVPDEDLIPVVVNILRFFNRR